MSKADRQANAQAEAKKPARGKATRNLVLLRKLGEGEAVDTLSAIFVEVASENEGIRTMKDIDAFMEEHSIVGDVYPVRFYIADHTGLRKPRTRREQKTFVIE